MPSTIEVPAAEKISHAYGTLELSLIVPSGESQAKSVHVPEKYLSHVLDQGVPFARRLLLDKATSLLEELVERQEAAITAGEPVEAAVQEVVFHGIGAKVRCAVMASVDPQSVEDVLRTQVLVPLKREMNAAPDSTSPRGSLLKRAQRLVRRLSSPVRLH